MPVQVDTTFSADSISEGFSVANGSPTADSAIVVPGRPLSYHCNPAGASMFLSKTLPSATRIATARFAVRVHTVPSSTSYILSATTTSTMRLVWLSGTSQIRPQVASTARTDATVLALDTWYWIQMRFDVSTTTGKIDYTLSAADGTVIATPAQLTATVTAADITDVRLGPSIVTTQEMWYGDYQLVDGDAHPLALPTKGRAQAAMVG